MAIYPHVLHTVVGNSGGRCSLLAKCTRQPCRSCPHCVQQGHEETAQVHAVIAFGHLHFHCWISAFVIWIATPKCNRPSHSNLFLSIGANIHGRCFWLPVFHANTFQTFLQGKGNSANEDNDERAAVAAYVRADGMFGCSSVLPGLEKFLLMLIWTLSQWIRRRFKSWQVFNVPRKTAPNCSLRSMKK